MTDRDLIKKLTNLKEIKPDPSWLKANRDSLYSQISNSGATNLSTWSSFVINLKSALKTASAPAVALASLMLIVIASSAYAHLLLSNTKPNQSLYIAREISEQAKLNTILNPVAREKMASQFAVNNAQDIATVLADPNFNNTQEIEKLNVKFNEEINVAKNSVARLEKPAVQNVAVSGTATSDEVYSATLSKDNSGISLSGEATSTTVDTAISTTTKILEEAQNLFTEKKFQEAVDKIDLIK